MIKINQMGDTYGGLLFLTISEEPREELFSWMMNNLEKQGAETSTFGKRRENYRRGFDANFV